MIANRTGAAVVAVVLLLLAAGGLAHGALVMARAELETSVVRARALGERHRALRALDLLAGADLGPVLDSVPVWDTRVIGHEGAADVAPVLLRRSTAEHWWASAVRDAPAGRRPEEGTLLWFLDATARVLALEAVVSVREGAPVGIDGSLDATRYAAPHTAAEGASCADPPPPETAARVVPGLATLPPTPGAPALGLLPFDSALARTLVRVDSVGTPAPAEAGGACLRDRPWSWGDPDRPWRPCGDHLVVRASDGPVRIDGGVGQGMLIVAGDATLTGGARFHGVVYASGALEVADGSALVGAALAAGGVRIDAGSRVEGSACWALRAFRAARGVWSARPLWVEPLARGGPT